MTLFSSKIYFQPGKAAALRLTELQLIQEAIEFYIERLKPRILTFEKW
jgi:hypothetical protein